ncbi:MAG: sigma-70 family RNA polymerase sigma factor [Planctomycetota bacterium]
MPSDFDRRQNLVERTIRSDGHRFLGVARKILGSHDLAEDAVAEAVAELWSTEEAPRNSGAWTLRTTVHRSLHLARTARRRQRYEGAYSEARDDRDTEDPFEACARSEARSAVRDAIDSLPSLQRRIIQLRELEGLEYADIAERLSVPIGTVRSRLNRARAALREALRDYEPCCAVHASEIARWAR